MSANDIVWIQIIDASVSSFGFLMVAIVCICLLAHWTKVGHRRLLIASAAFFASRALCCGVAAVDLIHSCHIALVASLTFSTALGVLLGMMAIAAKDDILRTLKTSEALDVKRTAAASGDDKEHMMLQWDDKQTRMHSEKLLLALQAAGRDA